MDAIMVEAHFAFCRCSRGKPVLFFATGGLPALSLFWSAHSGTSLFVLAQ